MLATMPTTSRHVEAPVIEEDRLCAGCNLSVSSESGGVVVAFGNSLWHVECFKCAKCSNQVNADTNLLLLSDGSPVCANCYNCKVCRKPILDEAVMTGDDSFHAECFTCRSCKKRIDELVFAKTSQGFYCMSCHNDRVARSRRHLARQKQKERERSVQGSSSAAGSGAQRTNSINDGSRPPDSRTKLTSGGVGVEKPPRGKSSTASDNRNSQSSLSYSRNDRNNASADGSHVTSPVSEPEAPRRSTSSIPPTASAATVNDHTGQRQGGAAANGESSIRALPEIPPPVYSASPPASGASDIGSARSSSSFTNNYASTEPTSPSLSVSVSHEGHGGDQSENGKTSKNLYVDIGRHGGTVQGEGLANPWPDDIEQDNRGRDAEGEAQPLSPSHLHPASNGLSAPSKKREKRSSMNISLQHEATRMMKQQRPGSPHSTSPLSPSSGPASSSKNNAKPQSPTTHPGRRDSHPSSPLHDYFVGIDDASSASTAFYSPSTSPQPLPHPDSPTSPRHTIGPTAMHNSSSVLTKFPQRSDSLQKTSLPSGAKPNGLPSSPYVGKLQTHVPRPQNEVDKAGRRLSPRDIGGGKRSRSASPAPPDVPRSIESGTDTETDNSGEIEDNVHGSPNDVPPALPPKNGKPNGVVDLEGQAPSRLTSSSPIEELFPEKEQEDSPSFSKVTERTSGFFIAPALPPMRFSMSGADFSQLLMNIGESPSKRSSLMPGQRSAFDPSATVTIPEEKSDDVSSARTPTSVASTITPISASKEDAQVGGSPIKALDRSVSFNGRRSNPPGPISLPVNGEASAPSSRPSSPPSTGTSLKKKWSLRRTSRSDPSGKVPMDASSPRSSVESRRPPSANGVNGHARMDSLTLLNGGSSRIPDISITRTPAKQQDSTDLVLRRLKEALADAKGRSADYIKLDCTFVDAIIQSLDLKRDQVSEMSTKLDRYKRSSQAMFDGLTSAQEEYSQELEARRDAEAEISRLKIELSRHAARITALTGEERRREVHEQLQKELSDNLLGLERDLSKLKVDRDMTLAEVEELSASKSSAPNGDVPSAAIGRSLTMRLDNIKRQYQHDLLPLTQQKEALSRELLELKEARDVFLEETAVLGARNEELAQLNAQYERKFEQRHSRDKSLPPVLPTPAAGQTDEQTKPFDTWKAQQAPPIVNTTSTSSSATLIDDVPESARQGKPVKTEADPAAPQGQRPRIIRWPGKAKDGSNGPKGKGRLEHIFQQISVLRPIRCDLCGDKMWGSLARCSTCNLSVHARCVAQVHTSCSHDGPAGTSDESANSAVPPPPSMFGRDLIEQVQADSVAKDTFVPVIVEKCIQAVEANAMEYEGVYRKSGGSGQQKHITALFERGDYDSFDLCDSESFNDISSITSVLKNYFRLLPNPLLTYGMHEAFVAAGSIKDHQARGQALKDLVKQLPAEHYHTLSYLMSHLHRVQLKADVNLMNSRNLGVIFGPTLMRPKDSSREFADMGGKSLAIQYLIENAPSVFPPLS